MLTPWLILKDTKKKKRTYDQDWEFQHVPLLDTLLHLGNLAFTPYLCLFAAPSWDYIPTIYDIFVPKWQFIPVSNKIRPTANKGFIERLPCSLNNRLRLSCLLNDACKKNPNRSQHQAPYDQSCRLSYGPTSRIPPIPTHRSFRQPSRKARTPKSHLKEEPWSTF